MSVIYPCRPRCNKVLVIAYVFPPIAYAGTYRTLRFCRHLTEYGWFPYVVTIERGEDLYNDDSLMYMVPQEAKVFRTRTVDFWRWWQRRTRRKGMRKCKNSSGVVDNDDVQDTVQQAQKTTWLSRFKNWVFDLVTIPDHMVFWVPFAAVKGLSLLLRNDIQVIYTSSPPHSEHLAGLVLSRLSRKPWVADFRDPMLDSSGYNPSTWIRRSIDEALEKLIVHYADSVLIISDHYRRIMESRYPSSMHKFMTMPNGFDLDEYKDAEPHVFDKFTILYAGSFYAERNPRFFLKSFGAWFRKQPPDTRSNVQVIFYGIMPDEVKKEIKHQGLDGVVTAPGAIPRRELIPLLKGADVLLLIIGYDPESRGTVTSKIFEYMACRRPILALVPEGDAADILADYEKASVISSEDIGAVEVFLTEVYRSHLRETEQSAQTTHEPGNGNNSAVSSYDARNLTKTLAQLFASISSQAK